MSRNFGRFGIALVLSLTTMLGQTSALARASTVYTYDSLGRVKSVAYANGDSVTYTYDAAGNRTQMVAVSSTAAPTVSTKSITTPLNTPGSVDLAPVGSWTSIAFPTGPTKGTLGLSGSVVTYTPNNGTSGSDTFTFTATGRGGTSGPATVNVNVVLPPAPTVSTKSISTAYNTAGSVNLAPSGSWTSIAFPTNPLKGTLSLVGSVVTYTPNNGTSGSDSFTFTATGLGGTSPPATVNVTVASPEAPTASAKSITTLYNTAGAVDLAPSGSWTSIAFPTAPTKGTLSLSGSVVTYTPTNGTYGADSFTFTATGKGGTSSPATVTVTVGVPPAPSVSTKSISTAYNTPGAVNLAPSGVWTSIAFPSGPSKGSLSLSGSTVTYTPTAGAYGSDSFTFTATGPGGTSAPATVSVSVAAPPAPTVSAKSISTAYNTPGAVNLAPSGVYTSVAVATSPAKGSVSIAGTTATYTPTSGTYGADSFTFTATGPGGVSAPAAVNITVAAPPVNHNPVANNDYPDRVSSPYTLYIEPLENDTDPDGDPLTIVSLSGEFATTATIINNGKAIQFFAGPGANVYDYLYYTISDGRGGTATGAIYLQVDGGQW